jgi:MFS family permease
MGASPMFQLSNMAIKTWSFARSVFIATFFLVAFSVSFCGKDWFIMTNMILFAFTMGYVSTLCAVKAPGTVSEEQRGQVGGFIAICLTLGIFTGSLIALGLTPIVNMSKQE